MSALSMKNKKVVIGMQKIKLSIKFTFGTHVAVRAGPAEDAVAAERAGTHRNTGLVRPTGVGGTG